MFGGCTALQTVPLLDTSAGTNFTSMIASCAVLQYVPTLNTSAGLDFTSMFNGCTSLQSIPPIDLSAATTLSGIVNTCGGMRRCPLVGIKESVTISSAQLGPAALNEIYTNLATVVGKTINVQFNYGLSSDDPSIATAKGWTVTG